MFHCPHCGAAIHENEHFCVTCGKKLPIDLDERLKETKQFNKWWFMPIGIAALTLFISLFYFLILQTKYEQAKHHYTLGADYIEEKKYEDALNEFEVSLSYHTSFKQARIAHDFLEIAEEIERGLEDIPALIKDKQYKEALEKIDTFENEFDHLQGQAVNDYLNKLATERDKIELAEIEEKLANSPSVDKLKILLWDAESISNDDGIRIAEEIREEIVDYTFAKASDHLNNNQFNDALLIVDDGLKYASDSTKLQGLKTTIAKEKSAFETAQQERIEQAVTIAEEEDQHNRNDAIKLDHVEVDYNEQGNIIVNGKVKSAATVPITSVFVEYELYTKGNEPFETNRVFVFPEILYPDEDGNFEFTHYDLDIEDTDILVNVNKITWYVD